MSKRQKPIKKIPPNGEKKGAPKVQIPSKPKPRPVKKVSSGSSKR